MEFWCYMPVGDDGCPVPPDAPAVAIQPTIFTSGQGWGVCEACGTSDEQLTYWHDWGVECPMASAPDYCTPCMVKLIDEGSLLRDASGPLPLQPHPDAGYVVNCLS